MRLVYMRRHFPCTVDDSQLAKQWAGKQIEKYAEKTDSFAGDCKSKAGDREIEFILLYFREILAALYV